MFRGALFGALRKVYRWTIALFVSSLLFAAAHFLQKPDPIETVTWNSGLVMLPQMTKGFPNLNLMMPTFINLTVGGHHSWFGLSIHREPLFFDRPARGLDLLAEVLRFSDTRDQ